MVTLGILDFEPQTYDKVGRRLHSRQYRGLNTNVLVFNSPLFVHVGLPEKRKRREKVHLISIWKFHSYRMFLKRRKVAIYFVKFQFHHHSNFLTI